MAERFVNLDRDTPLLLAPDMREWVPQDDMVQGIDKVRGEWELVCVSHNVKRLWNLKMAGA